MGGETNLESASWRQELLRAVGYLALAVAQTRIVFDLGRRSYGGGEGDPAQDVWVLSRVTHQLTHEPWRPFEGNLYFPSPHSVLFSDPLLGPAVLVLPLRLLTDNPVLLYNLAFLVTLTVSSLGFDRLARRLGATSLAAVLAGIVIPYSSQQMGRLLHLNLLTLSFFPFLISGLLSLLERPRLRAAAQTGLAFALQAATSGYHAFSCVLVSLTVGAFEFRRFARCRTWLFAAVAAGIAGVLLYPYVSGFLFLREHEARMVRDARVPAAFGLDLSWLFVSRSYLWRRLLQGMQPFFPGVVVLVCAALSLRGFRQDRNVRLLGVLGLVSLVVAVGPTIRWAREPIAPGPLALLGGVPLVDAMRHPFTLAMPAVMALGLLASLGLGRSVLARSRAALVLVLLLAWGETITPVPPHAMSPHGLPSVYTWLAGQPPGGILELPFHDVRWTWWAAHHQLPIVNGIGAFEPERYQVLWQLVKREWQGPERDLESSRALAYLKAWFPIRYLVVHANAPAALRKLIAATPRSFVPLHDTVEGDRVYALVRRGEGTLLRRALGEDQLRSGRLRLVLKGPADGRVIVRVNERTLPGPLALTPEPREHTLELPRPALRRGRNLIELVGAPGEVVFELLEIGPL